MRANIADYNAVVEAASKFTSSVAEGNSKYAKELFTEDACLFGFLNGKFERGSIEQFYRNVDTSARARTSRRASTCWNWRRRSRSCAFSKRAGAARSTSRTYFFS